MKTLFKLFMIIAILLGMVQCKNDLNNPEEFMYGKWKISSLDSCVEVVYPGATLETHPLLKNEGVFYFYKDGKCKIKNLQRDALSYIGNEYQWTRSTKDSIHFNFNSGEVSHSAFILYNNDKVEFNMHVPRVGINLWYRVVLKR
jgi:hypothetical protein